MFKNYPVPIYNHDLTPFYDEMAHLLAYLKEGVRQYEEEANTYQERSVISKLWFNIRNIFANNKPYSYAKELSYQLSVLQEMQEGTLAYAAKQANIQPLAPIDIYQRDVVDNFFSNNSQFNARSLLRLNETYHKAINNSRSLFDNRFSDGLKRHVKTIDSFTKDYEENQKNWFASKHDSTPLDNAFAWLQNFLNIPENDLTRVLDTDHSSNIHLSTPAMIKTGASEEQSELRVKKTQTSATVKSVTKDEATSAAKEQSKNLTLEQEIEVLRTTNEEQKQECDQLIKQAAINKQNGADNAHEVGKELRAIQKTELELDQISKDEIKGTNAIDDVRQSYGKGMKALDQFNEHLEKNNKKLEQMNEKEKNIENSLKNIDQDKKEIAESNARKEAAMKKYRQRKAAKSLKRASLSAVNMNNADEQIAVISEKSKNFNFMRRQ